MRPKKMTLLAGMALAIAFAAPAVVQAEVTLTEEGVPLEAGDKVTATSTNLITTTALGTMQCTKVTLHYEVVVNGSDHVALVPASSGGAGNGTAEGCLLPTPMGNLPAPMTGFGTGSLTINTWGTLATNITFTTDLFGTCQFHGAINARWNHAQNSDAITIETGNKFSGTSPCFQILETHGEFTIETPDGKPLQLSFLKTT